MSSGKKDNNSRIDALAKKLIADYESLRKGGVSENLLKDIIKTMILQVDVIPLRAHIEALIAKDAEEIRKLAEIARKEMADPIMFNNRVVTTIDSHEAELTALNAIKSNPRFIESLSLRLRNFGEKCYQV